MTDQSWFPLFIINFSWYLGDMDGQVQMGPNKAIDADGLSCLLVDPHCYKWILMVLKGSWHFPVDQSLSWSCWVVLMTLSKNYSVQSALSLCDGSKWIQWAQICWNTWNGSQQTLTVSAKSVTGPLGSYCKFMSSDWFQWGLMDPNGSQWLIMAPNGFMMGK